MKTLQNLLLDQLEDIYYAEKQLVRALPKMAKAATHGDLKQAFQSHLKETEGHVTKVEKAFKALGEKATARKCDAIVGLIKEADEMASDHKGCPTINAALIAAAQKVEHYEIATYGSLREWAEMVGNDDAADILQEILDEEKAADDTLTELARAHSNPAANSENESKEKGNGPTTIRRRGVRPVASRLGT